MSELEQSYRRLLLAYPGYYRRERGLEILTTLMDAAAPDQTSPHGRDAADLVIGGLRARLTPPRGVVNALAATVVALLVGLLAGGTAALAAWSAADTTPVTPAAVALGNEITGLSPVTDAQGDALTVQPDRPLRHDPLGKGSSAASEGWDGGEPAPAYVRGFYRPGSDPVQLMSAAYDRMQAQGWHMGAIQHWDDGLVFWASRDGSLVRVQGLRLDGAAPSITVEVHRTEPGGVTLAAVVGAALGLIIGWLVTVQLLHRFRRLSGSGARIAAALVGVPALSSAALLVLIMVLGLAGLVSNYGLSGHNWTFPIAALAFLPGLTIAVAAGLLAAAGIVATGRTGEGPAPGSTLTAA